MNSPITLNTPILNSLVLTIVFFMNSISCVLSQEEPQLPITKESWTAELPGGWNAALNLNPEQ